MHWIPGFLKGTTICMETFDGIITARVPEVIVEEPVKTGLRSILESAVSSITGGLSSFGNVLKVKDFVPEMSTREKVIVGAVAAYVVYRAEKDYSLISKPPISMAKLKQLFGCRLPMRMATVGPVVLSRTPQMESRRVGSEEANLTAPKCQVAVGSYVGGAYVAHGAAVRMDAARQVFLIMPDHVKSHSESLVVRGRQGDLDLTGRDCLVIDTDLVAIQLTDNEIARVGVSRPDLYTSLPTRGQLAQIVAPHGKGTTGTLTDDPFAFGRMIYSGTTLGGYSGAGYMVGTALAGLHQYGGQINGGCSASYVYVTLCHKLKIKNEDTEDFLLQAYNEGREVWVDHGWYDLDTARVRVGGQYHIVQRYSMNAAFGNEWNDEEFTDRQRRRRRDRGRRDYNDWESGESTATATISGASSGSAGTQQPPALKHEDLMNYVGTLTKKQRGRLFAQMQTLLSKPEITSGPQDPPTVLASTSTR